MAVERGICTSAYDLIRADVDDRDTHEKHIGSCEVLELSNKNMSRYISYIHERYSYSSAIAGVKWWYIENSVHEDASPSFAHLEAVFLLSWTQ